MVYNHRCQKPNHKESKMVSMNRNSKLVIEEVTDPKQIAKHRAQDERHARNLKWLESHWSDLPNVRGRYVAVANEATFVAETDNEAWNWARTHHPDDDGAIVLLVPAEGGWRIYANRR
jgi:hypothetical protein